MSGKEGYFKKKVLTDYYHVSINSTGGKTFVENNVI